MRFKIGDFVKILPGSKIRVVGNPTDSYKDMVTNVEVYGTIKEINYTYSSAYYVIKFPDFPNALYEYLDHELELCSFIE